MATIFITEKDEDNIVDIFGLSKSQFTLIVDALSALVKKELSQEEFDLFRGGTQGLQQLDLCDFPQPVFMKASERILKLCQENVELKPFAQELKTKLEADPRFIA